MSKSQRFPQEFIESVKLSNNIVTVAGKYFPMKAKGKTHWAACPFHYEKTPSFAINETQQFYHCFGCGVSGNVISLVMQLESVDFLGAIELLAKWAGLDLPKITTDENWVKNIRKKERVLSALGGACEFYKENLYRDKNKSYLEYLYKRGITDELIKLFNIGASSDWNEVINHLKQNDHDIEDIIDSGIAVKNEKGNIYDAMALRIVFPIFNIYGDCIGFTGRTLSTDKEIAKYKNTSQTVVFDKSNIVYGIDVLKKNKLANFVDKLIVVEGNVDVISLVGSGFTNTVACMGTALTQYHAKIFKRFTEHVYICFDGDSAGQKATLRSLDILAAENLKVRVICIPDNQDPDEYLKEHGRHAFEKLISDAKPLVDFKLDVLEKASNLRDSLGKTEYLKNALEILKPLAHTPQLELYLPRVSSLSGVSFDSIYRTLNNENKPAKYEQPLEYPHSGESTALSKSEQFIVASIVYNQPYTEKLKMENRELKTVNGENIKSLIGNNLFRRLLETVEEYKADDKRWIVAFADQIFEPEELVELDPVINHQFEMEQQGLEKYWEDSVKCLIKENLKKQKSNLLNEQKTMTNIEEKSSTWKKIQEIDKKIKELKK